MGCRRQPQSPSVLCLATHDGPLSQGPKEFHAEVSILSRIHHPHIVLLVGWCEEKCMLVYELMECGNLETHLKKDSKADLHWQVGGGWGQHAVTGQLRDHGGVRAVKSIMGRCACGGLCAGAG